MFQEKMKQQLLVVQQSVTFVSSRISPAAIQNVGILRSKESEENHQKNTVAISINNKTISPRFSSYYDLPFTVGPNVFFLGAADG